MHPQLGQRIDNQPGYLVIKLGMAAGAAFEEALVPLRLKGRHVRVLEAVHGETLSQQDLCLRTGLDRTTMVGVVDELEDLGYVRRQRSRTDRRKHVVTLTEQGAEAFRSAAELLAKAQDDFFAPLSTAERTQFHELAARLFGPGRGACDPSPEPR